MELSKAQELATELLGQLAPCCDNIEIVGSIRRAVKEVNDIDLLVLPFNIDALNCSVKLLFDPLEKNGEKIKSGKYKGFQADIYIATKETYETLKLIRTGSAEHNIRLTTLAKKKGWRLHASGLGLTNEKNEVIARTEAEIFDKLGIPYLPAEQRGFVQG